MDLLPTRTYFIGASCGQWKVARASTLIGPALPACGFISVTTLISKSDAWWAMPQDERRAIIESQSKHISTGLKYLPAIARKLHHSRDFGEGIDFVTWFEFDPQHVGLFDELLSFLRQSIEWKYVSREIEFRLE